MTNRKFYKPEFLQFITKKKIRSYIIVLNPLNALQVLVDSDENFKKLFYDRGVKYIYLFGQGCFRLLVIHPSTHEFIRTNACSYSQYSFMTKSNA